MATRSYRIPIPEQTIPLKGEVTNLDLKAVTGATVELKGLLSSLEDVLKNRTIDITFNPIGLEDIEKRLTALAKNIEIPVSTAAPTIAAAPAPTIGLNLNLSSNPVARNRTWGKQAKVNINELKSQIVAVEDFVQKELKSSNVASAISELNRRATAGSSGDLNIFNEVGSMGRLFANIGGQTTPAADTNIKKIEELTEYLNRLKTQAAAIGIDLTPVLQNFDSSADQILESSEKIVSGEAEVEKNLSKLKEIFGGGQLDTGALQESLNALRLTIEDLNNTLANVGEINNFVAQFKELKEALSINTTSGSQGALNAFKNQLEEIREIEALLKRSKKGELTDSDSLLFNTYTSDSSAASFEAEVNKLRESGGEFQSVGDKIIATRRKLIQDLNSQQATIKEESSPKGVLKREVKGLQDLYEEYRKLATVRGLGVATKSENQKYYNFDTMVNDYISKQSEANRAALEAESKRLSKGFENFSFGSYDPATVYARAGTALETFTAKAASKTTEYGKIVDKMRTDHEELRQELDNPIGQRDEARIEELTGAMQKYISTLSDTRNLAFQPIKDSDRAKLQNTIATWAASNGKAMKDGWYKTQIEGLQTNLVNADSMEQLDQIRTKFYEISAGAREAGLSGKTFGDLMRQGWNNLRQYLGSFASFYQIINLFKQGIAVVTQLDTALTEMRKVSDEPLSALREYQRDTYDTAVNIGTTALQLQKSTADFMRVGEGLQEAAESARAANILFNVSEFESIDDATQSLVAISHAYQDIDKMGIIDIMNELGNNFAISTDEIAYGLQNAGSALQTAGNDIYEAAAVVTAANTLVQDESKAAMGSRTIALRLIGTDAAKQELADLGEDVEDFEVTTTSKMNDYIKMLTKTNSQAGVSLLDMNGNYRSTYEILRDIANVWDEIAAEDAISGENRQAALLEKMAGKTRANILASILQSPDVLEEAYQKALNAEGSAEKENQKYLDSIQGKLSQLTSQAQSFAAVTFDSAGLKGMLDIATQLVGAFTQLSSAVGGLPGLAGIGTGIFGAIKAYRGSSDLGVLPSLFQLGGRGGSAFKNFTSSLYGGNLDKGFIESVGKIIGTEDFDAASKALARIGNSTLDVNSKFTILNHLFGEASGRADAVSQNAIKLALGMSNVGSETDKASSSVSGFGSKLKALWQTNKAGIITAGIGLAITAISAAYNAWQQKQQELLSNATKAGDSWKDVSSSMDEYQSKYIELNDKLHSVNLTEEESKSIKEELIGLQSSMNELVDNEKNKVDLLNDSLDTTKAKWLEVRKAQAEENWYGQSEAYEKILSELSPEKLTGIDITQAGYGDLSALNTWFGEQGFYIRGKNGGNLASGAQEEYYSNNKDLLPTDTKNYLNTLIDQFKKDYADGALKITEDAYKGQLDALEKASGAAKNAWDEYGETYLALRESRFLAESNDDEQIKQYYEYQAAVESFNESVSSGNYEAIAQAQVTLNTLESELEQTGRFSGEFGDIFEGIRDEIDHSADTAIRFTKSLRNNIIVNNLKNSGVKARQLKNELVAGTKQYAFLVNQAKALGFVQDNSIDSIDRIVSLLISQGYLIDDTLTTSVENADEALKTYSEHLDTVTEQFPKVTSALSNSAGTGGVNLSDFKDLKEIFGSDIYDALDKTARGYKLNADELENLLGVQKESERTNYLDALREQYDALIVAQQEIAQATALGLDTTEYEKEYVHIQNNISELKVLQSTYEDLTSAYNQWQTAMSSANEHDTYDSVATQYDSIKDLMDLGWTTQDDVLRYLEYVTGADFSELSGFALEDAVIEKWNSLTEAIDGTTYSIKDLMTVDENGKVTAEGVANFYDAITDVLTASGELEKYQREINGQTYFDFGNDDAIIAERLGIGVEYFQAIIAATKEAGGESRVLTDTIEDLKLKADDAKRSLSEFNINTDVTSVDEATSEIEKVKKLIDEVNRDDIDPKTKEDKLNDLNDILEYLIEQENVLKGQEPIEVPIHVNDEDVKAAIENVKKTLEGLRDPETGKILMTTEGVPEAVAQFTALSQQKALLERPIFLSFESSGNKAQQDALADLQNFYDTYSALQSLQELKTLGVEVDDSELTAAEEKLNGIISSMGDNPIIHAKFGIDEDATISDINAIIAKLEADPKEMEIVCGIDSTEVDDYTAPQKDGTVIYTANFSAVRSAPAPPKTGIVNYTARLADTSAITDLQRTVNINVVKPGSSSSSGVKPKVNGTAHAGGSWGLKSDGTALINELGSEIIVRDGKWFIVNDGLPTFASLKRGDIIFNHKQSEELLKNGYVTSGYGQYVSYARGTATIGGDAFSIGGVNRKSSYGTKKDKTGSGSGSGSGSDSGSYGNVGDAAFDEASDSADEFAEKIDWIEVLISRLEREIENFGRIADSTFESFSDRNSNLASEISKVAEEIGYEHQAYQRYLDEAASVGLDEEYAALVRAGKIDIESITDEDLYNKIQEYQEWYEKALESIDNSYELDQRYKELWRERFDLTQTAYQVIIDELSNENDIIQAHIDKIEEQGYVISAKFYANMISNETAALTQLTQQHDAMVAKLNEAVTSGLIKQYSQEWYDMVGEIQGVAKAIADAEKNIVSWNNAIRQLKWDAFDTFMDKVSDIEAESEFLQDILDAYPLFDETGTATDNGIATFGLMGTSYNVYMEQAKRYAAEMKEIDKDLAKDPNNQILINRRQELLKLQRDSIKAAEAEKDAIKNLVKDGIDKQLSHMKGLIDQYIDLIDREQEAYKYQKEVSEQQQEILRLEKQLAAYAGDNSEEGRLKRQQVQNSLSDARQELYETQEEKRIAETKQMLNDLYDDYEVILNERLDNIDALVQAVIDEVNARGTEISSTLREEAQSVSYTLSEAMNTIWSGTDGLSASLSYYDGRFAERNGVIEGTINSVGHTLDTSLNNMNTSFLEAVGGLKGTVDTWYALADEQYKKELKKEEEEKAKIKAPVAATNQSTNNTQAKSSTSSSSAKQAAKPTLKVSTSGATVSANMSNAGGYSKIGFALWSQANGQDDLKWYYVNPSGGNAAVNMSALTGSGKYTLHVYGWDKNGNPVFLDGSDFNVNAPVTPTSSGSSGSYSGGSSSGSSSSTTKATKSLTSIGSVIASRGNVGSKVVKPTGVARAQKQLEEELKRLKKAGGGGVNLIRAYASGTSRVPKDDFFWTNDGAPETIVRKDGAVLTKLNVGDMVLNNKAHENLWELVNSPNSFLKDAFAQNFSGGISGITSMAGGDMNVNVTFNLPGVKNYEEFMTQMRNDPKAEQMIQEITIGRLRGNGKLNKNNYHFS